MLYFYICLANFRTNHLFYKALGCFAVVSKLAELDTSPMRIPPDVS